MEDCLLSRVPAYSRSLFHFTLLSTAFEKSVGVGDCRPVFLEFFFSKNIPRSEIFGSMDMGSSHA